MPLPPPAPGGLFVDDIAASRKCFGLLLTPILVLAALIALSACATAYPPIDGTLVPSPLHRPAPTSEEATISPSHPTEPIVPGQPNLDLPPGDNIVYSLRTASAGVLPPELDFYAISPSNGSRHPLLRGVTDAAISPDASKLAYFLRGWLYLYEVSNGNQSISRIEIPTSQDACRTPVWSPDSQRLLLTCGDIVEGTSTIIVEARSASVLPVAQGCRDYSWSSDRESFAASCGGAMTDVRIFRLPTDSVDIVPGCEADILCNRPNWSPRGDWILIYRGSGRSGEGTPQDGYYLTSPNCDTSAPECTRPATAPLITGESPAWSPDGTRFALVDDLSILLVSPDTNEVKVLATLQYLPEVVVWSPDSRSLAFTADTKLLVYSFETKEIATLTEGAAPLVSDWIQASP